jgi:hypothetical protein
MFQLYNNYHIVMVGAGGNGSLIGLFLARLLSGLDDVQADIIIADGDTVEPKNLVRQHFAKSDLGKNKAQVLAERYSTHFRLNIGYYPHYIKDLDTMLDLLNHRIYTALPILVGAVDNNRARQLMHQAFKQLDTIAYVDCGCEETAGQAVLGLKHHRDVLLPPVAHYYPDVLEDNTPAEVGCAEAPIQDISANIMSAAAAFFYLNNIIAFKRVPTQKVTYDAHNMIMVPVYIKKGKEN